MPLFCTGQHGWVQWVVHVAVSVKLNVYNRKIDDAGQAHNCTDIPLVLEQDTTVNDKPNA